MGVQCNGLFELGNGLLMLALLGQHDTKLGVCEREIGVKLNSLLSQSMRAFERSCAEIIFIQRVDPSRHVSSRKHGIGPSVVRIEGDGAL
jgi:hypothetical protein